MQILHKIVRKDLESVDVGVYFNKSGETVNIVCNDGYIFNHDLMHQGGKLKCMRDISGSTYNWYVDNTYYGYQT